ncbi:CUB domain-containing protein 2-like [Glandiceps talaboti]
MAVFLYNMCIWVALLVVCVIIPYVQSGCSVGLSNTTVTFGSDEEYLAPNHPENYMPNEDCIHHFVADQGYKIRVTFQEFKIENREDGECRYDYIEFYDGDSTADRHLGRYCGSKIPPTVLSTSTQLLAVFVSDNSIEPGTFKAKIESVADNYIEPYELGQCGGFLRADQGDITSPGYPYGYEANEYCVYFISTESSTDTILLHFSSFDLEVHQSCQYDFIKVLDGDDLQSSPVISKYCGGENNRPPHIIPSTGNKITVIFHSDVSIHYEGFYAKFAIADIGFPDIPPPSALPNSFAVPVCDISRAIITDRGGIIVSHELYPESLYPNDAECVMVIVGGRVFEKVYLAFEEVELQATEDQDETCQANTGDYIEILDGNLNIFNPSVLGTLCGTQEDRFTASLYMQIKFVTDSVQSQEHKGFRAIYSVFYTDRHGCETGDFQCRNNRCIADFLVCDGHNHCGDNTDEDEGCGEEPEEPDWSKEESSYDYNYAGGNKGPSKVDIGLIVGICIAIGAITMAAVCLVIIKICSQPANNNLAETRLTDLQTVSGRESTGGRQMIHTIGHNNPLYTGAEEQAPPIPPKYSDVVPLPATTPQLNDSYQPLSGATAAFYQPRGAAAAEDATAPPLEEKEALEDLQSEDIETSARPVTFTHPLPQIGASHTGSQLTPLSDPLSLTGSQLPPLRHAPSSDLTSRLNSGTGLPPIRAPPSRLPPLTDQPPAYTD